MTLETLKANRNEIIAYLTNELGAENVKEGMNVIVEMIGYRDFEGYSAMEFAKASIEVSGLKDKIIFHNGKRAHAEIEERNIASSKLLAKYI